MRSDFEFITNLQYKVKYLSEEIAKFESGKKYVEMNEKHRLITAQNNATIKRLNHELFKADASLVTMRKNWFQVTADIEKEHKKELAKKDRKVKELEERAIRAERELEQTKEKLREKNKELYGVLAALEEEKGKNQKLTAQINRDYENSSISSSQKPNRKKITNNREKTGKKPGGQPGHKGHERKKHTPTNIIDIPTPEEYANHPDYRPTGKIITKQVVDLQVVVTVNEYRTPEYRNRHTGTRVHAEFPDGIRDEVSYGPGIKSFAFLLNNDCFVSIDKVRHFLSDLTSGELEISKGMINGLGKEFSEKTESQRKKAFADLLLSPVMNIDFSSVHVNGKNVPALVCATPETTLYMARESKGHKGIAETPVEDYQGILVHDNDKTFYHYGSAHQECLVHILRYLVSGMENEPERTWHKQMWELIREMIHYRNSIDADAVPEPDKTKEYVSRYRKILETAESEYDYVPPSDYYRDGYNLYKRLKENEESHLLFLYNEKVPSNNNLAERLLRQLKRKSKQVMAFRSNDSFAYLCDAMGIINSLRRQGENLFESVSAIFN